MEAEATCGGVDRPHDRTALRIGAIFVILGKPVSLDLA